MQSHWNNLVLVAEKTTPEATPWTSEWYGILAILIAVFVVPLFLSQMLAKAVRMRDYTGKFYLILFLTIASAITVYSAANSKNGIKKGIDLGGGTTLIYEVDPTQKSDKSQKVDIDKLIAAVRLRVDPAGIKQVTIRAAGEEQIEVIIPEIDPAEVDQIKKTISTAGLMEFRILADQNKNADIIARASVAGVSEVKDEDKDASREEDKFEIDVNIDEDQVDVYYDGRIRARWVPVEEGDDVTKLITRKNNKEKLRILGQVRARWIKAGIDPDNKESRVPDSPNNISRPRLGQDGGLEFLVIIDEYNVEGRYLASARSSFDQNGKPSVNFNFNSEGANLFGELTAANQPDPETGTARQLGIILDDELLSAPNLNAVIRASGEITGSFTSEETDWLSSVLDAGSLPAALSKTPIREAKKSAMLGKETIEKGATAITISLIAVMLFMPIYYSFSGLVACMALTLNLLFVLAVMILLRAAFTLPGLAGLVLTVGMAVDANVLIFERIREELDRGSALRMAIRNGFNRATRTIVDANLTTLITGVVLYAIGTDLIKGFAVTLILGVGLSMFTAIFFSRVVFDVAEKRRWLTKLKMMRAIGNTHINFTGKRHIAMVCSLLLIGVGMWGVFNRGSGILGIDFTGGSEIQVSFTVDKTREGITEKLLAESDKYAADHTLGGTTVTNVARKAPDTPEGEEKKAELIQSFQLSASDQKEPAVIAMFVSKTLGGTPKVTPVAGGSNDFLVKFSPGIEDTDIGKILADAAAGFPNSLKLTALNVSLVEDSAIDSLIEGDKKAAVTGPRNFSIVTSQSDVDVLKAIVERAFPGDELKRHKMDFAPNTFVKIEDKAASGMKSLSDEAPATDPKPDDNESSQYPSKPTTIDSNIAPVVLAQPAEGETPEKEETSATDTPNANSDSPEAEPATDGPAASKEVNKETPAETPADSTATAPADADEKPNTTEATDEPKKTDEKSDGSTESKIADVLKSLEESSGLGSGATDPLTPTAPADQFAGGTEVTLTFSDKLNQQTLRGYIESITKTKGPNVEFEISNINVEGEQRLAMKEWTFKSSLSADETATLLGHVQAEIEADPYYPFINAIGGQVAGDLRVNAFIALGASLLFIVGYIWIRFQQVMYGLAAVVALVHDVLITLGVIALSAYLADGALGQMLMIDEFKISLAMMAAFLTIIGYSLNDTIVVFDRVREVRGKSPELTEKMINDSVNQTLSRTLITSLTTLIVVLILYIAGGSGIHGFAFALVVGVLVGTYSSIFVASPVLLWLSKTNLDVPVDTSAKKPVDTAV